VVNSARPPSRSMATCSPSTTNGAGRRRSTVVTPAAALAPESPVIVSSRVQRGGQLGLAVVGYVVVQAPVEGALQAPADLGALGQAGGEEVVAGDAQPHVAPAPQPVVRRAPRAERAGDR